MNKEEYDKYKKIVDNLDGYDICDEFDLSTYELKDKKKLLKIVLIHYFKNQDEIERLNNENEQYKKYTKKFEEWLEIEERRYKNYATDDYEGGYVDAINTTIVKLQELKEGK